ncbi:1-deoxy-D-xylulose-5-phosphate synthase [Paratractidigestivibacter sp.]|uniref:1-deoxy-D-xylulose-5-phosphate synthase n=1 Tax=Paratractidigestivibacter sp. TaxID=2847316 RepID=UPI002AC9D740|nr:1-deoxy-D-xylulose-5-phosphate synthase [Paratractidigestivibacter sp.]
MYLEKINGPADVRALSPEELPGLAAEIRCALVAKLAAHGGHVGPNLGIVETTIALHRVFDSPTDKLVFDVSHQTYVHKMLTGRAAAFTDPERYDDVSGYSEPSESEHDHFVIGHTSTSVSLACGLAKGRDLVGESYDVVAVIGDGSLSGGEAFEGLDWAAELGSNLIIVVNDNQMSIAENHGGLYGNLAELRATNGECENNYFRALGLDYRYVADGNDEGSVEAALAEVRGIDHPVVVHVNTEKGHGWQPAVDQKERFHWDGWFDEKTGESKLPAGGEPSYNELTYQALKRHMEADPRVVAISSATPTVMGFTAERRAEAGRQFVDVGIAEEHAVALASGIAAAGGVPVYGFYGTFIQRGFDQLMQDLCVNGNPAVLLSFADSVCGMNDVTHLGIFDIPELSAIPGLTYLAPTSREEYLAMLDWAILQRERPVAIRVPAAGMVNREVDTAAADWATTTETVREGADVAILGLGCAFGIAEEAAGLLAAEGVSATLVNPRVASGLADEYVEKLAAAHKAIVTVEDGQLEGGFGEKVARQAAATCPVYCAGVPRGYYDRYDPEELKASCGLTPQAVAAAAMKLLAKANGR